VDQLIKLDKQATVAYKSWMAEAQALPSYVEYREALSGPTMNEKWLRVLQRKWYKESLKLGSYRPWNNLHKQIIEIINSEK